MKNYIYIKDKEFIDFCDRALEFFYYIEDQDHSKFDPDHFISRPIAYQMTREFAEAHGLDLNIMNHSPYFSNIFRFLFTGKQQKQQKIHLDYLQNLGVVPATINFPLQNCNQQSKTSWYRIISGVPTIKESPGGKITSKIAANFNPDASNCELELLEETYFDNKQPHLFRTSRWHEIINSSDTTRVVCSFFFTPPMIWEDIVAHCDDIGII